MERFYSITGRTLCVRAFDDKAAFLLRDFSKNFRLTPSPAQAGGEQGCVIDVCAKTVPPVLPSGYESYPTDLGHCHTNHESYYFEIGDSVILTRPRTSNTIKLWFGAASSVEQASFDSIMPYAVEIALRHLGLYQLHGAGVIEPKSGACALLLGASRSGKTTLTLSLVASGWRYLTDDALLIHDEAAAIRAYGLRAYFAASSKSLAALRSAQLDAALGEATFTDPSKRRIDSDALFPGAHAESCVPRRLFFPVIVDEVESRVVEITQSEAMARFLKTSAWAADYDAAMARDHLRVLGRLVKQCRTYNIHAGSDILGDSTRAAALLAPHVAE